ncbi:MAG: ABC transporter substrate-binding protein [Saezia sp.]
MSAVTFLGGANAVAQPAADAKVTIAITSIVEHPALDAVRDGVKLAMEEAGYHDGKNLRWIYQTAQGNVGTAAQIARKFAGDQPDVIVAISTPSAQTMLASTKKIPIVFSAITDPIGAKLVPSWEASGTNVTGVSNILDIPRQIDLILQTLPSAKRVGIIYNPAEANSSYYVQQMQELMPARGLTPVVVAAPRSVDVSTAARSLIGRVDVIYTPSDNNVISAYEGVAQAAMEGKIPLVSADPTSVSRGATVGLGVDYTELGAQTGRMVLRILNGEAPGTIKPERGEKLVLIVNLKAAQAQGFTVPQALIDSADKVIE